MSEYKDEFYFGANTSDGFISLYEHIAPRFKQKKIFVIKGGPGTGKSSIMRKIGEEFSKKYTVEYGYCSSDPDSLDAVNIKELGVTVLDGTPPHPFEPRFPGALESIVDLYPFFDETALEKSRNEIEEVSEKCSAAHEKALKYISVAAIISRTNMSIVDEAFLKEKAENFVKRLVHRKITDIFEKYSEKVRFLSAITPKGVNLLNIRDYKDVYIIEDEYKRVSGFILEKIRQELIKSGQEFITCYCVLSPYKVIEHIFVPDSDVAFLTSNSFHKIKGSKNAHIIRANRFLDENILKLNKEKLKFNRQVKKEMIEQAIKLMNEAKRNHDDLEQLYVKNVNFDMMQELIKQLIQKIESISKN